MYFSNICTCDTWNSCLLINIPGFFNYFSLPIIETVVDLVKLNFLLQTAVNILKCWHLTGNWISGLFVTCNLIVFFRQKEFGIWHRLLMNYIQQSFSIEFNQWLTLSGFDQYEMFLFYYPFLSKATIKLKKFYSKSISS